MAANNREQSDSCGYCFQSGGDMRVLPCSHTAHLECLLEDFSNMDLIECPSCQREFEALDLSSLPKVDSVPTEGEELAVRPPDEIDDSLVCDVCKLSGKREKAIAYCIDCEVKACDVHITQDHPKDNPDHETVEFDNYRSNPDIYKNVRCSDHNKRVTKFCSRCEEFGCELCAETPNCKKTTYFSDEIDLIHHLYEEITNRVRETRVIFDERTAVIAAKLKSINESWKDVWPRLDLLEGCCESLLEQIQKKVRSQYQKGTLKATVKKYLQDKTDLVEVFSVQLMDKKDKLEALQSVIHRFLTFNHGTDIIKLQESMLKSIEDTLAIRVAYCEWKNPVLLDSTDMGKFSDEFEIGFGIPSALTKFAEHSIGRHCYSVCYKPDGELVVGRDFTVRLYNKQHEIVRDVGSKYPTSVVSANGKIYFTNLWDFGRVVEQTEQLDDPNNELNAGKTFYSFTRSYTFNQMDVNENWSALVNGETAGVLLYNIQTQQKHHQTLEDKPNYVNFHRDGDLLLTFTTAGQLVKYNIRPDASLVPVWTCNLENPCGVCTDEMGLIFVRSGESDSSGYAFNFGRMKTGVIFVVTKEGKRVKSFGDINLLSTKGGMSIYGDTLAIAGWGQQCYQLYKMYY